jgi:formylmethanofuran dehydrogenase subunit B
MLCAEDRSLGDDREGWLAVTCGGCGCGCDDLRLWPSGGDLGRLEAACPLGEAWFARRATVDAPLARIDGVAAELSDALQRAAEILTGARMPLLYGLGQVSCEAQRRALAIAEAIGATVATAGELLDGSTVAAYQALGSSTATLGEIRDRAQLLVIWRADPLRTHPRLLSRLSRQHPAGTHSSQRPTGMELVVVDSQRHASAREADLFIELAAELDFEALWALRALVRGLPVAREQAPRLPWAALESLASRLCELQHVAFLYDAGLLAGAGGPQRALALQALLRDLNRLPQRSVHAVGAHLRREGNAAGAEAVLTWQSGYPGAVSFRRGWPRASAEEFSAVALISGGEVDAVLVVGSDPLEHLPAEVAARLRELPIVSIDSCVTETAEIARVAITAAAAGVHATGTMQRLDGVPVGLRAVLEARRPAVEPVLDQLAETVAAHTDGGGR